MRKFIFITISVLCFSVFSTACMEKSNYDSLSKHQQQLVDTVLENTSSFSGCNGIRFSVYNGKTYFLASWTKYSSDQNSFSAGYVEKTKYYVVTDNSFTEEDYDVYNGQTAYGVFIEWDSGWDSDTKKETLAGAIKAIS